MLRCCGGVCWAAVLDLRGDVLAGVLSTEVLLAGAVLAGAVLAGAVLAAAVLVLLAVLAVTVLAVAVLGSGAGCGDVLAGVLSAAVLAGAVLAGSVLAAAVLVVLAVLAVAVLAVLRWRAGRRSDVWESAGWGTQRPPSFGPKANSLPKIRLRRMVVTFSAPTKGSQESPI